jgi:uncharacterized protein YcbK (DUF882 family)
LVLATRAIASFRSFVKTSGAVPMRGVPTGPSRVDVAESASTTVVLPDTMRGRSGVLRFATLTPAQAVQIAGFVARFGERAVRTAAIRVLPEASDSFALITLRAFADKRGEYVGPYRLGRWPAERWLMARNYYNPDGFVEVTPADSGLRLSPHFTLGEFLTHDQRAVWPKFVVLEPKLIDKLELILQDLTAHGFRVDRVVVLSGFRAPYYNEQGMAEGMARASRHQYGDAADIIIDSDGDGSMDDLTGDHRVDLRDVRPLEDAIARVEAKYPELVGGLGTYAAFGPRGPFAHVDVRGTSARWERVMNKGR